MVKRETLCHVLKIYDIVEILLNGIKSICINSFSYVRVKERKMKHIELIVRQKHVMSS